MTDNCVETSKACVNVLELESASFQWRKYINWLQNTVEENMRDPLYQKYFVPILKEEKPFVGKVFLSVVIRTQGRRPEALREALLCMASQSDQDFEVLLIGHKLDTKQKALVLQVLEELEPEFRQKVRFFELNMGNRSMPLNIGFAHAWGEYIAVLDDDDIVFEDWVQEYHNAAKEATGAMLHAYVLVQPWDVLDTAEGEKALRATGAPQPTYCTPFHMVRQLTANMCPLIGLAFPRIAFAEYGFHFDEEMTTTEDWDCFMRVAMVFGVKDICTPTSIYRLWQNAESSSTVHPQEEWEANYYIIREKYLQYMFLAAPEDMPSIMEVNCVFPPSQNETEVILRHVVDSFSFKIGRAITFIPRAARDFIKEVKFNGWKSAFGFLKGKIPGVVANLKNLFKR